MSATRPSTQARTTAAATGLPVGMACCVLAAAMAAAGGCAGTGAHLDAQVGTAVTAADLPTARYDLDELNTATVTLHGASSGQTPGAFWYVQLVVDLSQDASAVTVVRECLYVAGSDRGAAMFGSPNLRIAVRLERGLLGTRLRGTIEGRLGRVASLGDGPTDESALLKAAFLARPDSLGTFHLVEEHAGLIRRLRERREQLQGVPTPDAESP
jgi:hypothetical protein